ncbi:hypothetical protein B6U99_04070 [Candidatus Geothermarchaeota archaeon ex4572_27]|nr:MAG: hypothetical protein B6U99_04070 [Candidatus Geothermarchaeota archaeon ex4572_27]
MKVALPHLIHLEALGRSRREAEAFFATFFLTSMSTYMAIVFVPLYALKYTGDLSLIALLATSYYVAFTASLPLCSRLSDRTGAYSAITMAGAALTALTCLAIPALTDYWQLLAVRGLQGVAWAFIAPMGAAMASMTTTKALRGRAVSVYNLSVSLGYLAGSIVGGLVSEAMGIDSAFILGGLASAAACILAFKRLKGWRQGPPPSEGARGGVGAFRVGRSRAVYVCFALRNVGATGIWALFPIYLAYLGASELWIGVIYMVNLASQSLLMSYVGSLTDRLGRKPIMLLGLFGSSAVFALYGLAQSYLWIIPVHVLLGLSWSSLMTASAAYIGDEAPEDAQATMMGLLFMVTGLAWIAGSSMASGLVKLVGLRGYMFVASALSAIGGLYGIVGLKETIKR